MGDVALAPRFSSESSKKRGVHSKNSTSKSSKKDSSSNGITRTKVTKWLESDNVVAKKHVSDKLNSSSVSDSCDTTSTNKNSSSSSDKNNNLGGGNSNNNISSTRTKVSKWLDADHELSPFFDQQLVGEVDVGDGGGPGTLGKDGHGSIFSRLQDHATIQKSWSTESGSPPGMVSLGEGEKTVVTPLSDVSSRRKETQQQQQQQQQVKDHQHRDCKDNNHRQDVDREDTDLDQDNNQCQDDDDSQDSDQHQDDDDHLDSTRHQDNPRPYSHERVQITRVGSTTESMVDSWAPALAMKQGVFDTAPYDADGLERPSSRRYSGDGYRSGGGGGGSDGGGSSAGAFDRADPLHEALTLRLSRPASRRGAIPMFGEEFGASYGSGGGNRSRSGSRNSVGRGMGGGSLADTAGGEAGDAMYDSMNPLFGAGRAGPLSPIHSALGVDSAVGVDSALGLDAVLAVEVVEEPLSSNNLKIFDGRRSEGGVGEGVRGGGGARSALSGDDGGGSWINGRQSKPASSLWDSPEPQQQGEEEATGGGEKSTAGVVEEDPVAAAAAAVVALASSVRRNGFVEVGRGSTVADDNWMCAEGPKKSGSASREAAGSGAGGVDSGGPGASRAREVSATDLSPDIVTLSSVDYGEQNGAAAAAAAVIERSRPAAAAAAVANGRLASTGRHATDRHDTRSPSRADATTTTTSTTAIADPSAMPDERISPYDVDNASLWARAATAAAAAASSLLNSQAQTGRESPQSFPSGTGLNFQHHRQNSWTSSLAEETQGEIVATLRRAARGVRLTKNTAKIAPARRPQSLPPAPDASARMTPVSPSLSPNKEDFLPPLDFSSPIKKDGSGGGGFVGTGKKGGGRGPDTEGGRDGKTPLVSPSGSGWGSDGGDTCIGTGSSDTGDSEESGPRAVARVEVEGDLEQGGSRAAVGTSGGVAARRGGLASARVAPADATRAAVGVRPDGSTVVLPCAPSDAEKVLYHETDRFGLIFFALMSFFTMSAGMWLFTIVTPAFYWFGVPAVFVIVYMACHYFGVAVWGKDFCPKEHAEVLREAERQSYRPAVDVFLPVCKEPVCVLENTWKHVAALDYPYVKVYVLDDGASDETRDLAASFGFNYIRRDNAPELKKAGNLRYAFARTSGEAIAILDADFCPRADFLKETVPYFNHDASIGILQTPQFFRFRDEQTWIEQGAGVTQEFFYRMVQVNQDKFNAAVCVGSCGLYRRQALEPFGGMAAIAHSEDMYTGYKMTTKGFSIKYLPLVLAMGACPDDAQTFFMQQYRWCMGSATLVLEKEFWRSSISKVHKLCFLNGMLYYVATALLVFLAPVPILLLVWCEADGVLWYHSAFALPSILFAAVFMPLWSKQRYGMACHRVKVLQCYAHMYAVKDRLMGRSAPWVPSGAGASRGASKTYASSVRLMVVWNIIITALIVGGSAWRMTQYPWYHFLPAVALAGGSFLLNISTLFH